MSTKERPIIFSAPMVRAILDGNKTQTRRAIKWPLMSASDGSKRRIFTENDTDVIQHFLQEPSRHPLQRGFCPYGKPGDKLWVRETWVPFEQDGPKALYRADADEDGTVPYLCTGAGGFGGGVCNATIDRWRPSVHMPRWASRITLEITGIRVERLQQISEADAMAEGCPLANPDPFIPGHGGSSASGWFSQLWEDIHGAGSWHVNPWVWVVEFRPLEVEA